MEEGDIIIDNNDIINEEINNDDCPLLAFLLQESDNSNYDEQKKILTENYNIRFSSYTNHFSLNRLTINSTIQSNYLVPILNSLQQLFNCGEIIFDDFDFSNVSIKDCTLDKIKYLHLNCCDFGSSTFIFDFIYKQKNLQRFYFKCGVGCQINLIEMIFESLSHKKLTHFQMVIDKNILNEDSRIFTKLCRFPKLTVLELFGGNTNVIEHLIKELSNCSLLNRLEIRDCNIGNTIVVKNLCDSLPNELKTLSLINCGITSNGFTNIIKTNCKDFRLQNNYICEGLVEILNNIKKYNIIINLANNPINKTTYINFANKLKTTPKLNINLDLQNTNIDDEIAGILCDSISDKKDITLILGNNNISDSVKSQYGIGTSVAAYSNCKLINCTIINYFDDDNTCLTNYLCDEFKLEKSSSPNISENIISHIKVNGKKISFISLTRDNFLQHYSILQPTTTRLVFIIADKITESDMNNNETPGYKKRISDWIDLITSIYTKSCILLAFSLEINPYSEISKSIDKYIKELTKKYGKKIMVHDKIIYFSTKYDIMTNIKSNSNFGISPKVILDNFRKKIISSHPLYIPNINTEPPNKIMLKEEYLKYIASNLSVKSNFDLDTIFRQLERSRVILQLSEQRICTDVLWFHNAIINTTLDPSMIVSKKKSINIPKWIISENSLQLPTSFMEDNANFYNINKIIGDYLAKTKILYKISNNNNDNQYFYPLMLPKIKKKDIKSDIFQNKSIGYKTFVILHSESIIPSTIFNQLQYKLYEITNNNINWICNYTKTTIYFKHINQCEFFITFFIQSDKFSESNGYIEIKIYSLSYLIISNIYNSITLLINDIMRYYSLQPIKTMTVDNNKINFDSNLQKIENLSTGNYTQISHLNDTYSKMKIQLDISFNDPIFDIKLNILDKNISHTDLNIFTYDTKYNIQYCNYIDKKDDIYCYNTYTLDYAMLICTLKGNSTIILENKILVNNNANRNIEENILLQQYLKYYNNYLEEFQFFKQKNIVDIKKKQQNKIEDSYTIKRREYEAVKLCEVFPLQSDITNIQIRTSIASILGNEYGICKLGKCKAFSHSYKYSKIEIKLNWISFTRESDIYIVISAPFDYASLHNSSLKTFIRNRVNPVLFQIKTLTDISNECAEIIQKKFNEQFSNKKLAAKIYISGYSFSGCIAHSLTKYLGDSNKIYTTTFGAPLIIENTYYKITNFSFTHDPISTVSARPFNWSSFKLKEQDYIINNKLKLVFINHLTRKFSIVKTEKIEKILKKQLTLEFIDWKEFNDISFYRKLLGNNYFNI